MSSIDADVRGHAARNVELVRNLKNRGVELEVPRSTEHHFLSKSQRDAARLADALYKRGFFLLVLAPAAPRKRSEYTWNVEAGINISVEHAASEDFARSLVELAATLDSIYDGWGTSV